MGFITNIIFTIFTLKYMVNAAQLIEGKQDVTCQPGRYQMANPDDPNTFYKCDNGKAILFQCSKGSRFDPDSEVCVQKTEGRSKRSGGSNNPDNESWAQNQAPSHSNGGFWWTQTSPRPKDFPSASGANRKHDAPAIATTSDETCIENGPQYIKNPADCSTFFLCSQGQAILTKCPEGQYYNSEMAKCDSSKPKDCSDPA